MGYYNYALFLYNQNRFKEALETIKKAKNIIPYAPEAIEIEKKIHRGYVTNSPYGNSISFEKMLKPIIPYTIKGVIWYQGEGIVKNAAEYDRLFPALISDWREQWGQGDFPFLFVQLANYMKQKQSPTQSGWARFREAQSKTLNLNNTAMGITIDIGDANDIHPKNKKDVGYRLATQAQRLVYNQQKSPNPPAYKACLLYTSPSPRDLSTSRMPSSA